MKFKPGDIIVRTHPNALVSELFELYMKNGGCFIIEAANLEHECECYKFKGDAKIRIKHKISGGGWILNANMIRDVTWSKVRFRPIKPFKFPNR